MKIVTNIDLCITDILKHMDLGNPIILPTDTNYNLACFPDSREAVDKVFQYKRRPKNKALSLFFLHPNDWTKYGICENAALMDQLVQTFWPGPLNIVIPKKNSDFDYMLNGLDSIALGSIANPTWRKFMKYLDGKPVAITSANISGTVSDTLVTKEIAVAQLENCVNYFIESESAITASKSSTIISVKYGAVEMLREGDIKKEMLLKALSKEGVKVE